VHCVFIFYNIILPWCCASPPRPSHIIIIIIYSVGNGYVESTKLGEPRVAREKIMKRREKNRFPLLCPVCDGCALAIVYHVRVWRRHRSFCVCRVTTVVRACVRLYVSYYYYYVIRQVGTCRRVWQSCHSRPHRVQSHWRGLVVALLAVVSVLLASHMVITQYVIILYISNTIVYERKTSFWKKRVTRTWLSYYRRTKHIPGKLNNY